MSTAVQKNFIREMIKENQFQNVGDIYGYLKDLFKDTIQEMLEAELDVSIGYPKNEKLIETDNERNGYPQKTVKSQFGELLNPCTHSYLWMPYITRSERTDIF
jgi:transposase-like protein